MGNHAISSAKSAEVIRAQLYLAEPGHQSTHFVAIHDNHKPLQNRYLCIAATFLGLGTAIVIEDHGKPRMVRMVQAKHENRFTVLLANEQEGWHQTVRGLLAPQGVKTVSAHSGREALELLETFPVHVAVLDDQMPQLGGLQVIRMLRDLHKATPAILLTDRLNHHLLQEALGMQVFSVLGKPVDFNVLLDALARVLRRYHENRWPDSNMPGEG
jgi:CheY-like chemotaxis protein